ncbi:MAG: RNase adapter RapZ [Reyranella sp.]|uniref:RNase adapter RapZ n=1 Tax=Reyranella sp. TaxID=1929291 RepID=UPI0027320D72|nr:RNase adapter RapZ [Reyranella sp.]MDP1967532.1 RNase adapter RapZ [Reyranella sp.]MDP2374097.1 RNase adapter RapZ [Reyranella sp.]
MIATVQPMPDSPSPSSPAITSERRPFVLVTGLSGAGRMTALNALEDMGYVAVDNMPLPLLGDLMRSTAGGSGTTAPPLAFGVDTRTFGFDPQELVGRVQKLRQRPDLDVKLLFLDCDTEALQRRYTESRRPHPLAPDRPVIDSIVEERRQVGWMRDAADLAIDTSALSPHALKQILAGHFALGPRVGTRLSVMSFSFRRGLPREADLVFDARFLKNPHYEPALKPLTGRDPAVASFIATDPDYAPFLGHLRGMIEPLLPRFDAEGKSYLTIAVGCTGGRHRSVAVAEALADWLRGAGRSVTLTHRDADGAGGPGGAG